MILKLLERLGRKRIIMDRIENEPYLERYYLFLKERKTFPFNIFLHKFLKGDPDDVHDHPAGQGSMTNQIHPTAVVAAGAKIGDGVEIGPHSVVGHDVGSEVRSGVGSEVGHAVGSGVGSVVGSEVGRDGLAAEAPGRDDSTALASRG